MPMDLPALFVETQKSGKKALNNYSTYDKVKNKLGLIALFVKVILLSE